MLLFITWAQPKKKTETKLIKILKLQTGILGLDLMATYTKFRTLIKIKLGNNNNIEKKNGKEIKTENIDATAYISINYFEY